MEIKLTVSWDPDDPADREKALAKLREFPRPDLDKKDENC